MIAAIIFIILILLGVVSIKSYTKKLTSGCCGTENETIQRIKVKDRNKDNYKYERLVKIKGMSCRNCAIRIENAFNELDGIWAKVNLSKNTADVLMKEELDEIAIENIVSQAGYIVSEII